MLNVTVWNEFRHEKEMEHVKAIYPDGMHKCIADFLNKEADISARVASLDEPDQGLPAEVLESTDVLLWWGHGAHQEVSDELVDRIQNRVLRGMGLIVLHSGHHSKIFKRMMGTSCNLIWRDGARERIWCASPGHPIAQGVPAQFELPVEEMYGECFDIPNPDATVFISWFNGGEVFRSGCTFTRGRGKIFYFQPGHEENPTYHNKTIQKIITNAVHWAKPEQIIDELICPKADPLETV